MLGIVGPTGVGKTGIAIKVCKQLGGEIVSCDSRQIYRGLDIGTAKPTEEEKSRVKHHLIDIIEIGEQFSANEYRQMALEVIDNLFKNGIKPVVVGGTGLYYRALTEGFFEIPENDPEYRNRLELEAEEKGNECLWDKLNQIDPQSAQKISKSDRFRIIRALEIFHLTGRKKSELSASGEYPQPTYNYITIGLNLKRKHLYKRINKRVEEMFDEGWIEETRQLISSSRLNSRNISKLMGYNTLYYYLRGELEIGEAFEKIKQAHRNYAKRQLTWFKRVKGIRWISSDDPRAVEKIVELFKEQ